MALDSYDDGVDAVKHLRGGGPDAGAAAGRTELAEPRSRQECYEALRAADGKPVQGSDDQRAPAGARADSSAGARADVPGEARTDRSGWDTVDSGQRPPLDAIRITPERIVHVLEGDKTGGGHRHGTGKPGKTEFPAGWNDEKIIDSALDVARKPDKPPVRQDRNDTWLCSGTRANVEVSVVVARSGEIVSGWPEEGGPGVVRNPRRGTS
jgi:EndoU nuclease-like protein